MVRREYGTEVDNQKRRQSRDTQPHRRPRTVNPPTIMRYHASIHRFSVQHDPNSMGRFIVQHDMSSRSMSGMNTRNTRSKLAAPCSLASSVNDLTPDGSVVRNTPYIFTSGNVKRAGFKVERIGNLLFSYQETGRFESPAYIPSLLRLLETCREGCFVLRGKPLDRLRRSIVTDLKFLAYPDAFGDESSGNNATGAWADDLRTVFLVAPRSCIRLASFIHEHHGVNSRDIVWGKTTALLDYLRRRADPIWISGAEAAVKCSDHEAIYIRPLITELRSLPLPEFGKDFVAANIRTSFPLLPRSVLVVIKCATQIRGSNAIIPFLVRYCNAQKMIEEVLSASNLGSRCWSTFTPPIDATRQRPLGRDIVQAPMRHLVCTIASEARGIPSFSHFRNLVLAQLSLADLVSFRGARDEASRNQRSSCSYHDERVPKMPAKTIVKSGIHVLANETSLRGTGLRFGCRLLTKIHPKRQFILNVSFRRAVTSAREPSTAS
ncbi:uncharacterized protein BT62DRAFT_999422 [Guyanagaster necrorhizus]|uniref:Uncharacterized protein n=1 Tax=Guyanagaster necrorhizus TaxID=856835 RepID=A0A9P7W430_9AGAR|nr:uncharacterized protein BT62DRAFT_999422 [Guyanagaster necrorhizus MCA 3950]KAG7451739.1 hypothetical protein BT62DRAFT_999422 [Guyanagaster necrorhizus MCA 3950]